MIVNHANGTDNKNYLSIQDIIAKETQEIAHTHFADHDQLSEFYVSRGESYLFVAQYEKAIEDFDRANFHIAYSQNTKDSKVTAFRVALGKVISCD
jgi:hypothetical protein